MKLIILGSGSSGNGYILQASTGEVLVIEAGVPFKDVKKALNFKVKDIRACIISHAHNDHFGHVKEYENIPIYASPETLDTLTERKYYHHDVEPLKQFSVDSFSIMPFDVKHDVRCYGYLINHKECGNILFMTDLCYTKYTFQNINNILIEANYKHEILERNVKSGIVKEAQQLRTIQSHLSIEMCKETLLANDLTKVNNIVLIHLSNSNSDASEFVEEIIEATEKRVFTAVRNLTLDFNKIPF